jgi:hypothetical protein
MTEENKNNHGNEPTKKYKVSQPEIDSDEMHSVLLELI